MDNRDRLLEMVNDGNLDPMMALITGMTGDVRTGAPSGT